MPIMTEPFSRVAIDIVGPLNPPSDDGHKYILTLIDFATGFPEAIPLREIDSVSVAEALLVIFSRVGILREIFSDRGTQFTSQLMGELHKLLGIKPLFTTPYHPSGNGRVERFHSTLKASLRKLCVDKPKDWHRYLIPILFALREIPNDRTRISAFELLYGRAVRGPLTVLRDLWEDRSIKDDERTFFQYVIELRDILEECSKIAAHNADISSTRYRSYFDVKSQDRSFTPGDEVLVLLPDTANKLLMTWSGPYTVMERRNKVNYLIMEKGQPKLYHANLLKMYHRRANVSQAQVLDEDQVVDGCQGISDVAQSCVDVENEIYPITPDGKIDSLLSIDTPCADINSELTQDQQNDIHKLISDFSDVFSETPGCTSLLEHDITLSTTERLKPKIYPIPLHLQTHFEEEVDQLYKQGIIRLSSSPHCSPVVMVRQSDGMYRMAIDYRALNSVTVFHAEPACKIEDDLHKFNGAVYFSELDLTKAYYQIPLSERSKPLTAFPTQKGLMEFFRLPFGLVTACATYVRLMRLILVGLPNVAFYFDNIFIYTKDWKEHLEAIISVLERLREHNLTVRPSKCRFGFNEIRYLGFGIDGKHLKPQCEKIDALMKIPPPTTKKTLRSFLGMISFYRMFIPQASELTAPLSDLLRKNVREPLMWTKELAERFEKLKFTLCQHPVLKLPDPDNSIHSSNRRF